MTEDEIPVRGALEGALYEIKRVIVGQDAMLERLLVALLAGGHVLLEGVPGPRQDADRAHARRRARRLLPPHPVHARPRAGRPRRHAHLPPRPGRFDTELGPVFGNFLLADEINRAPAKVQSALLEVMQEHQVTIGGDTYPVPRRSSCSPRRTRSSPRAPTRCPRRRSTASCSSSSSTTRTWARRPRSSAARSAPAPVIEERLSTDDLERFSAAAERVFVDRDVIGYAVALADATRHPERYGLAELAPYIEYGASPRGPIGLIGGRARSRCCAAAARDRRRRPRPRARRPAPPPRALLRRARRRRDARRHPRPRAGRGRRARPARGARGRSAAAA